MPDSPALNRESDCVLRTKRLEPFVMIFFAIPAVRKLAVKIQASFHVNDCEEKPPLPMLGMGGFSLLLHTVGWFAYRTKHMDNWPQHPYICYYDGYIVPVLIGTGERECRAEFRIPTFELSETELVIRL